MPIQGERVWHVAEMTRITMSHKLLNKGRPEVFLNVTLCQTATFASRMLFEVELNRLFLEIGKYSE
jgi:hypothetical protein